jgi:hypothetical protein
MNLVLIGNLKDAKRIASRAVSSVTPPISNITRPGLTTATQNSGAPLQEPIRADIAGHGASSGFYLAGSDPGGFYRLERKVAKANCVAAGGNTAHSPALLFAEFGSFRA